MKKGQFYKDYENSNLPGQQIFRLEIVEKRRQKNSFLYQTICTSESILNSNGRQTENGVYGT